ncbi:hypothetical protein M569_17196, partial [Genlisea aurea]
GYYSRDAPEVKVVFIDTQYVETDAVSFKSVVQKFTGKDSVGDNASAATTSAAAEDMDREMSFKDVDFILNQLPPIDEFMALYPQ